MEEEYIEEAQDGDGIGQEFDRDNIDQEFDREEDIQLQQETAENYSPNPQDRETKFAFLKDVVQRDDSTKVSNLRKEELGMLPFTVRDCKYIALKARMLGRNGFAMFFERLAEDNCATSLSRDGALLNIAITNRSESVKHRGNPQNLMGYKGADQQHSTKRGFMK